jgi:Zn-dependent peptidase ImmA (M78 family)
MGIKRWSGLAVRLPDDSEVVLYNDAHSFKRVRATLMEEFFHIRLHHPRSSIRILSGDTNARSFDGGIEEEAYASGAAALVPYVALRQMVSDGLSVPAIARVFNVSTDLVSYRLKVTKLFRRARRRTN